MDKNGGGVKVTYIETQFVTSDVASFKDLVQRLTGRSPAPEVPHRPMPCRASDGGRSAAAWQPQGSYCPAGAATAAGHGHERAPACQMEDMYDMGDLSELLYVGARERALGNMVMVTVISPIDGTAMTD